MIIETIALIAAFGFALYAIVAGAYEFMDTNHRKGTSS